MKTWRAFNVLGRLAGFMFTFVGLFMAYYGYGERDWLIAGPGLVAAVLGILLLLAKPISSN